jgi:hypothetical protein
MTGDESLVLPEGTRLLHIGPHKTGTTSLQGALWTARESMRAQGVRHAGPTRNPSNAVRAVTGQPSPYSDTEPPPISHWEGLVRELRSAREPRVIVSSEFFSWANPEAIRRIVDDVGPSTVQIVVTLRPLARILPSMWQQNVQAGQVNSFESWLESALKRPEHPFWTLHRHDLLIARWAAVVGLDRVTAIVVDERDHGFLPRTIEQLLGLRLDTLAVGDDYTNRSLTLPEVEAVRAFNVASKAEGVPRSIHARIMRFGAAQEMKRRRPPADERRVELPAWSTERIDAIAAKMVAEIRASGVRVLGDLDQLARPAKGVPATAEGEPMTIPPEIAASMAMGILVASGAARDRSAGAFGITEPIELARMPSRQLVGYAGLRVWRSTIQRLKRIGRRAAPGR